MCGLFAMGEQNAPPDTKISLPDPAYIGLPIWMHIVSPTGYKSHYPSSAIPNDFYCNQVEVKQAGLLLPATDWFPGRREGWSGLRMLGDCGYRAIEATDTSPVRSDSARHIHGSVHSAGIPPREARDTDRGTI